MPYRPTEWAFLVRERPEEARRRILDAHLQTGGNTLEAANVLQVSRDSLENWITKLQIRDEIRRIREQLKYRPVEQFKECPRCHEIYSDEHTCKE